eukprot:CAMPEP_0197311574 /NCGR_PEP_ID=MMETSP0891-20130614/12525_1 /TAXON_ID=44058 ORGANISM="Aureoumbra lagunensis, Strain CCMP1510" /NCGR_SAMPLE_ID=MMETSP0891 /ASSEMBLY_ACC=CAM_ASM_000534 /LENGTH=202 /DNA_ID=CAMNT_0042797877 /DNA_START=1 /DNA_END=606 /DNA_ORIENTATION=-
MGNLIRIMKYSQKEDMKQAIEALRATNDQKPLQWWRLADNCMGGMSATKHEAIVDATGTQQLRFAGEINTNGGGFTSIRANIENGLPSDTSALYLKYRGDGKTYKVLLSNGESTGPFSSNPSWQHDLPTAANQWCETKLQLKDFKPSIGGTSVKQTADLALRPNEQKQIGLMLSLLLSDGSANPPSTFGQGIFPFELLVSSF